MDRAFQFKVRRSQKKIEGMASLAAGESIKDVASKYGVKYRTAWEWFNDAGLRKPEAWTKEVDAKIIELTSSGKSPASVAKLIGHSASSVYDRCRKLGINVGIEYGRWSKRWTPEMDSVVRKMYADHTYSQIAEALGNGVTYGMVKLRTERLCLDGTIDDRPLRPRKNGYTNDDIRLIVELRRGGMGIAELCRKFELPRNSVRWIVKRYSQE